MCLWPCLLISEPSCKEVINLVCLENTDGPPGPELVKRLLANDEPEAFKMSLDKAVASLHIGRLGG